MKFVFILKHRQIQIFIFIRTVSVQNKNIKFADGYNFPVSPSLQFL